jgi:hypothetical protein
MHCHAHSLRLQPSSPAMRCGHGRAIARILLDAAMSWKGLVIPGSRCRSRSGPSRARPLVSHGPTATSRGRNKARRSPGTKRRSRHFTVYGTVKRNKRHVATLLTIEQVGRR